MGIWEIYHIDYLTSQSLAFGRERLYHIRHSAFVRFGPVRFVHRLRSFGGMVWVQRDWWGMESRLPGNLSQHDYTILVHRHSFATQFNFFEAPTFSRCCNCHCAIHGLPSHANPDTWPVTLLWSHDDDSYEPYDSSPSILDFTTRKI